MRTGLILAVLGLLTIGCGVRKTAYVYPFQAPIAGTDGVSGGLLALGFAAEQPWVILAGALLYDAVVAWQVAASEYKAQTLSLYSLV
jgi:hypothetical protein